MGDESSESKERRSRNVAGAGSRLLDEEDSETCSKAGSDGTCDLPVGMTRTSFGTGRAP